MGQGERDRERRVGERTRPARDGAGAGHTSTDAVRLGTAASEPLPTMGLTHLAPVARMPGGTGPQVAAAGGLGPASSSTVVLPARAAAHGPPDSAQAAGGGALRGPEAVSQWPAPAPALAASGLPTQGKHPCRVGNDLHQPCGRLRGREVPLCSLGPRSTREGSLVARQASACPSHPETRDPNRRRSLLQCQPGILERGQIIPSCSDPCGP